MGNSAGKWKCMLFGHKEVFLLSLLSFGCLDEEKYNGREN